MSAEFGVCLLVLVVLGVWLARRKPRREHYRLRPTRRRARRDSLAELAALVTWFW